ncbi:MAG TPA: HlyD family efflux transporter periplasmic adaptor subunit [Kofleriaceae bacterium]|nr:HlyD family efflux transporter periplasmic adaptor subunit [Kofleriaceae bacterium]
MEAPTFLPHDDVEERSTNVVRARSASVITSAPRLPEPPTPVKTARASQPSIAAPQAQPARASQPQLAPYVQFEGGASFDPNALPLPPELAPTIYQWLRRLALQNDLAGADKLLRDAFVELTSALSVVIFYPGPDGLVALGGSDEQPKDTQPIVAVANARRALVSTHTALVPVATATETVAVVQLTRNPRQPAFELPAQLSMAALARECAGVIHHLVVQHLQRAHEHKADQSSLYRPEALDNHRNRGQEGVLAELSPSWVRRTYPILCGAMAIAIVFASCVHVPTYSTGLGVVVFPGTPVTAPTNGTVDELYVQSAQQVHKGDLVVKLASAKEDADLEQARTEYEAAVQQYLIDSSDETLKKTLVTAKASKERAEASLEQRTVRAPCDGTVSDVRIRVGGALQFGEPILTIVAPGTEPELWAFLPGSDRPRLHPGMDLQVDLTGYTKSRENAKIYDVGRDVIGAAEARHTLGAEIADAVKLSQDGGAYVIVKARLPAREFKTEHHTYHYHQGMPAKTEVRVESKRFLVTLLPDLEKVM